MDVLLVGVEPHTAGSVKRLIAAHDSKVRFHSPALDNGTVPLFGSWDVIIIGNLARSHAIAESIKKNRLQGLKIVLTEKENLRSAIDFWSTDIYSYFLKPINRDLFQLLWQNSLERVELRKKLSRLSEERKKERAGAVEQQECLKDLFTSHLKLQELNQEKSNYLARTSHELLTPLTAVQGYLQLLLEGRAGQVNELQQRVLGSALESCHRVIRLAGSLTDLIALDQNTDFLQLQMGDIRDCVLRSIGELKSNMDAKKMLCSVEAGQPIPPFRFDFDRMQQVLVNLLSNAVKFTPEGGQIRVTCEPHFWDRRTVREMIYGSGERRGNAPCSGANSVRIRVEDSGVGIPAEFLHDIFEEYSRVTNETGTPKGFGLGLAVARRVVLAHQGKIWAESTPSRGSTFTVLIPLLV